MSSHDLFEQKEYARIKRREKKRKLVMKMTGKGMKRFAMPAGRQAKPIKPLKPIRTR